MNRVYYFDRGQKGQRMVEGAKVTNAASEAEALERAKAMFPEPECKKDVFVLRNPPPLDRGKVLAYIESISYTDDFGDWFLVPDLLTEEINSGRLDVEES